LLLIGLEKQFSFKAIILPQGRGARKFQTNNQKKKLARKLRITDAAKALKRGVSSSDVCIPSQPIPENLNPVI